MMKDANSQWRKLEHETDVEVLMFVNYFLIRYIFHLHMTTDFALIDLANFFLLDPTAALEKKSRSLGQ